MEANCNIVVVFAIHSYYFKTYFFNLVFLLYYFKRIFLKIHLKFYVENYQTYKGHPYLIQTDEEAVDILSHLLFLFTHTNTFFPWNIWM